MNRLLGALVLLSLIMGGSSCLRYKDLAYFQDVVPQVSSASSPAQSNVDSINREQAYIIRVKPYDILDVKIISEFKATENVSNNQIGAISNVQGTSYTSGTPVDAYGEINLPVLNRLKVSGLTIREIETLISGELVKRQLLAQPFVTVKFLTFRVQVSGEVNRPGIVVISNERANLLEALALSGDLTDAGDRTSILILRGDLKNNPQVYSIDLRYLSSLQNSPAYAMMPNDLVYIKPTRRKFIISNANLILSFIGLLSIITSVVVTVITLSRT